MAKKGIPHSGMFHKGHKLTNPEVTSLLMAYKDRRNQFTLSLFQRIESLGDDLINKALEMALAGNEKMMFFLLERCINSNLLNRLEKTLLSRTVENIDSSQQFVIEKMGEGTIEVQHGLSLLKGLSLKRDTINVKELEDDVNKIKKGEQN